MEIQSTSPVNLADGLPLQTIVRITFDEEVDRDSVIDAGSIVVTSSASKLVVEGPSFENLTPDPPHNYLESVVYTGVVDGVFSTEDDTVFTFTPTNNLLPNATYRVIVGTRVVSRTIGTVAVGAGNTGTGSIALKGPYDGIVDTFTLTIADPGLLGVATFTYTRTSTGLASDEIATDRLIELEDGLYVSFKSGTYEAGDEFSFEVFEGVPLDDLYSFSFSTGAASYVEVSEDPPSFRIVEREIEGLKRIDNIPSVESGTLALISIVPSDQASNVALGFETITLTFNKALDPDSLSDTTVEILMENLPLDEIEQMTVPLRVTKTISGNKLILRFQG